jgi:hypothetical protein
VLLVAPTYNLHTLGAPGNRTVSGSLAAFSCVVAIAACGSSHTPSSTAGLRTHSPALEFAACMRANGVSSFPDPGAGGAAGSILRHEDQPAVRSIPICTQGMRTARSWRCPRCHSGNGEPVSRAEVRPRLDADGSSHATSRRPTAAPINRRAGRAPAHGPAEGGVSKHTSPSRDRSPSDPPNTNAAQRRRPRWPATCESPGRCDSPTPRSRRSLLVQLDSVEMDKRRARSHGVPVVSAEQGASMLNCSSPWRSRRVVPAPRLQCRMWSIADEIVADVAH